MACSCHSIVVLRVPFLLQNRLATHLPWLYQRLAFLPLPSALPPATSGRASLYHRLAFSPSAIPSLSSPPSLASSPLLLFYYLTLFPFWFVADALRIITACVPVLCFLSFCTRGTAGLHFVGQKDIPAEQKNYRLPAYTHEIC